MNLPGEVLANLAQDYVYSINNGAVPNIESAWNNICKTQCQKAYETCITNFKENMSENLKLIIP